MSWIGPSSSSSDGLTRPPAQVITRSDGTVISSLSSLASPSRVMHHTHPVRDPLRDPVPVRDPLRDPSVILALHLKKVNDLVFAVSDRRKFRPLTIPYLFAEAKKWWNVSVNYWLKALTEEEVEYMEEQGWPDETFEETARNVFDFFGSRLEEKVLIEWMWKSGIGTVTGGVPEPELNAINRAFHEVIKWFEERLRSKNDVMRIIYSINRKYKS